jgi:predicted oxidoreductase
MYTCIVILSHPSSFYSHTEGPRACGPLYPGFAVRHVGIEPLRASGVCFVNKYATIILIPEWPQ